MTAAELLARKFHAGQKDKNGWPYVLHLERVAKAVSPGARNVAWLHDILEDCPGVTQQTLLDAGIEGWEAACVQLLTRVPPYDYASYIQRIAGSQEPVCIEVKVADIRDHLREDCPESLRPRYEAALRVLCPAGAEDSEG